MNSYKSHEIKTGIRHGFANGNSKMGNRVCYGYCRDDNEELIVHPEESKVVQWIYQAYLAGATSGKILKELVNQKILSPNRKEWSRQTIDEILKNEKYTGDVLLQKTHSHNGRKVVNKGEEAKYIIRGHHNHIIAPELFQLVKEERLRRPQSYRHKGEIGLSFPEVQMQNQI